MSLILREDSLITGHIAPYNSITEFRDQAYYSVGINTGTKDNNKTILYIPGSGTSSHTTGFLPEEAISRGYTFISILPARLKNNNELLWRHGYGNTNSPNFMGYTIQDAYGVLNLLEKTLDSREKVIIGNSRGGTATLGLLAGLANTTDFSKYNLKGVYTNGASIASSGVDSWVDPESTIRTVGDIIQWSRNNDILKVINYSPLDNYMPPKMLEYVLKMSTDTSKGNIKIESEGTSHSWMNEDATSAKKVIDRIDKIFLGE